MTDKREKPLFLDMDPDEALAGFIQTDPVELKRRLETKKPPPKRGPSVTRKSGSRAKPSD